jgi:hypothetical protein
MLTVFLVFFRAVMAGILFQSTMGLNRLNYLTSNNWYSGGASLEPTDYTILRHFQPPRPAAFSHSLGKELQVLEED